MKRPEFSLLIGAACGFMSFACTWMKLVDREILEYELYLVAITRHELGQCKQYLFAKRAVKVSKLHDRHRRFRRAFKRRSVYGHINAQHRRRFQINNNLGLR